MEARDKVAIEESKINMEFKHDKFLEKSHWRLLDDRILIYKKGELVEEVFLEDITNFYSIYHSRGILQFFVGKELYTLRAGTDNPKFFEAGEYIKENCGVNYYKKILDSLEWRMRCNVCGQVFCYSYNDLMNNSSIISTIAIAPLSNSSMLFLLRKLLVFYVCFFLYLTYILYNIF